MDKILIVDDLELSREVLTFALEGRFECDSATNGEEAIERLKKTRYDAVLLDIVMPKVDGFGVMAFMKEHFAGNPDGMPPVIVLTSSLDDDIREKCLTAGAVETLIKPFRLNAVNAALKKAGLEG